MKWAVKYFVQFAIQRCIARLPVLLECSIRLPECVKQSLFGSDARLPYFIDLVAPRTQHAQMLDRIFCGVRAVVLMNQLPLKSRYGYVASYLAPVLARIITLPQSVAVTERQECRPIFVLCQNCRVADNDQAFLRSRQRDIKLLRLVYYAQPSTDVLLQEPVPRTSCAQYDEPRF